MLTNRLLSRAAGVAARQLGIRREESIQIFGRTFVLAKGTARLKPDYDDAWVYACAKHAEVVFDIGANVGWDAALILTTAGIREVVLVEPNAEALGIAANNLVRNGLSARARFVNSFVADVPDQQVRFWTVGAGAAGSAYQSHARSASQTGSSVMVNTTTVDALCRMFGTTPDFIKVDVEGAELKVLQGAEECVRRGKTRWLVEVHSCAELPITRNTSGILQWAELHGQSVWYLARHEQLTSADQVSDRGRFHALVQPSGWPYPEWLKGISQGAPLS